MIVQRQNALRQVGVTLAICSLALAVCCAIIATSDLRGDKVGRASMLEVVPRFFVAPRRILYGLGSGEEQDAANHAAVAFGTFAGQDEYAEELLGEDHYATQFFNALQSDEVHSEW